MARLARGDVLSESSPIGASSTESTTRAAHRSGIRSKSLKPTAEEQRAEDLLPYRKLYAAVILLAVKDAKHGGYASRTIAAHWLLASDLSALMLEACGLDVAKFRRRLLTFSWFRNAAPIASARLLNPL